MVSTRDFLNALAYRVLFCVQYIRHSSYPLHSPEHDLITYLMGHVPLLCIPDLADFIQDIGIASLGAKDDEIDKFFKVKGICRFTSFTSLK